MYIVPNKVSKHSTFCSNVFYFLHKFSELFLQSSYLICPYYLLRLILPQILVFIELKKYSYILKIKIPTCDVCIIQ